MLPRIPFAPDFNSFAGAGSALAELHLSFEKCEQYPLEVIFAHKGEPQPHHFRLTEKAMRFADDTKTTLKINEHVRLTGIPEPAHRYVVNGRTPLSGTLTVTGLKRTRRAASSTTRTAGLKTPATSSPQSNASST